MSFYRNTFFIIKGLREYTKSGFDKAATTFSPSALDVDCTGKICLVTGANSGIGKEVALEYAKRGGGVYMVCRSKERGEEARQEIIEQSKNGNVWLKIMDLSDLHDIDRFVKELREECPKIDVLVNNGGTMINERTETKEGVEANFATNTLGTYFLTLSLLDLLEKARPARVITVASAGMLTQKLDNSDLESKKHFDGTFVYAQNKRQQVVLTELWAKKYEDKGISFYSCHPGWADTPAVRTSMPDFYERLKDKLRTARQGADTVIWLSISNDVDQKVKPGDFVQDRSSVPKHLPLAWTPHDPKEEEVLIAKLEEYVQRIFTS